jgi:hypothetical protein
MCQAVYEFTSVLCLRPRSTQVARKTARRTCFITGTDPAFYIDPRVASVLLPICARSMELLMPFTHWCPTVVWYVGSACLPDPEAVFPHLRLETAVCTGLSFWLEAATASLRPRCCVGLAATRAALNGFAARGMVIAAMVLCGMRDPWAGAAQEAPSIRPACG